MNLPLVHVALALVAISSGAPQKPGGEVLQRLPRSYDVRNLSKVLTDEEILNAYNLSLGGGTPTPQQTTTPISVSRLDNRCRCVDVSLCNVSIASYFISARIINEKCDRSSEVCCKPENLIPEPLSTSTPIQPSGGQCGIRNYNDVGERITVTDNLTHFGEFPWMVGVLYPNLNSISDGEHPKMFLCGGSLIHPQVVLTTAHCVQGYENLIITAGEWDSSGDTEEHPHQYRNVSQVVIHKEFVRNPLTNDVALLILAQPVDMSQPHVGLICLPQPDENMNNRDCVSTGWGKNSFGKKSKSRNILKFVELPMVPNDDCQQALRGTRKGEDFILHGSFVCAGGVPGQDTCKGDGGGPLVCPLSKNSNKYVQAGIVSWGLGCGRDIPGVYTSVPYFVNWIYNELQSNGLSISS